MKAMILAAGLGQRMRPLTDHLPKPLLPVAGKPLLQYHLESLQTAGIRELVINLAYLGDQIRQFVGDGSRWGLSVAYSEESEPLETGGGLLHALPLLGEQPILLINGDVWSDIAIAELSSRVPEEASAGHLVLVPNPSFHPAGDFFLPQDGALITPQGLAERRFTFAGISIISPSLIANYPQRRRKFPLVEVLRLAIEQGQLTGEVYRGGWSDVGTPERLQQLESALQAQSRGQDSILKS